MHIQKWLCGSAPTVNYTAPLLIPSCSTSVATKLHLPVGYSPHAALEICSKYVQFLNKLLSLYYRETQTDRERERERGRLTAVWVVLYSSSSVGGNVSQFSLGIQVKVGLAAGEPGQLATEQRRQHAAVNAEHRV